MSVFEYKKEYEIGHLMLDKEHQQLFKIANEAFDVVEPSQKKDKIASVIKQLTDYLNINIQHEEEYMMNIGYPLFNEQHQMHKKINKYFNEYFNELKENVNKKSISDIEKELAYNIEKFIINHIKLEDIKMRQWSKAHNIDLNCVEWKESYSIGNELIDNEHQHLFEIANEAFVYAPKHKRKEKIKHTIHELYGYMKENFIHEEELMKSIDYPDLEEHIKQHQNIEEEMNSFAKKIPTMTLNETEEQLALFIEQWLVLHVIHEDNKIAKCLKTTKKEDIFDLETNAKLDTETKVDDKVE